MRSPHIVNSPNIMHSPQISHSPIVSVRSVHDASAASDDEPPKHSFRIICSFIVVYTMIFFNGCCFTAVVPSVPFYLRFLGAPPEFLGWVVSFYSLGQIFGSPTAGWLVSSNGGDNNSKPGWSSKTLLTFSSALGLVSSVMYATAPAYIFILISRLITGFSAGCEFTTELTFIANNTTPKQRTSYLASVTACNVVGFIMGPAVSMVLSNVVEIDLFDGLITFNQFTAPGWLLASMFCIDLAMVRLVFSDDDEEDEIVKQPETGLSLEPINKDLLSENDQLLPKTHEESDEHSSSYGGVNNKSSDPESATVGTDDSTKEEDENEPPPRLSLVLCLIFVQFSLMCGFSLLETITSPLVHDEFNWKVDDCNLLFTAGGFVSLTAYVAFVLLSKCVQDRKLVVGSLILSFFGFLLGIDWDQLSWVPYPIKEIQPPYLVRFLVGFALMNAGFMTGRPVVFALYSKLIAKQYQGEYLGWMVAGGSAARTLGPFAAVWLYYNVKGSGENLLSLFGSFVLFHSACLLLVVWQWPELLPQDNPVVDDDEPDEHKQLPPSALSNRSNKDTAGLLPPVQKRSLLSRAASSLSCSSNHVYHRGNSNVF